MYFHKFLDDEVKKGDVLMTFYSAALRRIKDAQEVYDEDKLFTYS